MEDFYKSSKRVQKIGSSRYIAYNSGESPRGLVFVDDTKALAACFYSGTIVELTCSGGGGFNISHETLPFGFPGYSGNPRDIVLDPNDRDIAWVSNLGRNLVHCYSIGKSSTTGNLPTGLETFKGGLLATGMNGNTFPFYIYSN